MEREKGRGKERKRGRITGAPLTPLFFLTSTLLSGGETTLTG